MSILLTTLNARYSHAALGLRYLMANLGELRNQARMVEFTLDHRPADIVEQLLDHDPKIIGFGVYIWNSREITEIVALLKQIRPEICLVLGGPEVSHEWDQQAMVEQADYVITGQADLAFAQFCRQWLAGQAPSGKILKPPPPSLGDLVLPYDFYSDQDIAHRTVYVEASRGCPFKCEFCLSALDKTVYPFDMDYFLAAMERLWQRGLRKFKFVDRTFNLKSELGRRILEFFLQRPDPDLFLHFELIPDRLPGELRALVQRFPPGSLQFEIGLQSFNPEVQVRINRRQDNDLSMENLRFLRERTEVHLHTDLIVGLPGEDLASFARGFDRLVTLNPHEIQVGILKRLRGAPIRRHEAPHAMRYNPCPPYNVLANDRLDFKTLQRLGRFARYWDLIGNSGRFTHTLPLMLGDAPFDHFLAFSDWLYAQTGQTHRLALDRLFEWVYHWLSGQQSIPLEAIIESLGRDYQRSGMRKELVFLGEWGRPPRRSAEKNSGAPARQSRHLVKG